MAKTETNHNFNKDLEAKDQEHKNPDTSGSSITHWSVEADEAQASDLSKKLAEKAIIKVQGLRFLEEHNLPRYKKISVDLQEFLANPASVFTKIPSKTNLYYSSIIDSKTGERIFGLEQNKQEVKKFIAEKLANQEISLDSQLTLSEYWHNYYGGNLLVDELGKVFVELVEGKHAKLVKGEGPILLSAETNKYTKVLQFSENQEIEDEANTKLRQAIVKALNLIPKQLVPLNEDSLARFQEIVYNEAGEACISLPYSGYYEFILTKEQADVEDWKVIFIDARTGEAAKKYQLVE